MKRSLSGSPSKRDELRTALHQRILRGDYAPSTPLRQIPLAREFGVAQSVVREILQELDYHGLVRSVENVGVFVRELGAEQLLQAYQVREMFEGLAARLCCQHASRADVQWLERMAERIHAASFSEPPEERGELEQQFHFRFVEISHNETLERLSYGYRFLGNLVVTDRDRDELLREHVAMVRAVADNQPEEAERLARAHVRRSAEAIAAQREPPFH